MKMSGKKAEMSTDSEHDATTGRLENVEEDRNLRLAILT